MDRRQFLSLSAAAWLRAAQGNPALAAADMQQAPDFEIAFITDTAELDIGKHHIIAKVTWPDGTIVTESVDFTVTN